MKPVKPSYPVTISDFTGYNAWPMIQAIGGKNGGKLVCAYRRGKVHDSCDPESAVYARTSTDCGETWTPETLVFNTSGCGNAAEGKGLDENGAMLLWVQIVTSWDAPFTHLLFRSTDGIRFTHVATPEFAPNPVQITGIVKVPTVGLMALWFAGSYNEAQKGKSWGTLTSCDNGATWTQTTVEDNLTRSDWPTEPSAVYLGGGKILAIARTEVLDNNGVLKSAGTQFQLVSNDFGKTWKRSRTNIDNVFASTPSLIFDEATGLVSNYYYERGKGVLWRRIVKADDVFDMPLNWAKPEPVAHGSEALWDAGNVNATICNGGHCIAYYSGKASGTSILLAAVSPPDKC